MRLELELSSRCSKTHPSSINRPGALEDAVVGGGRHSICDYVAAPFRDFDGEMLPLGVVEVQRSCRHCPIATNEHPPLGRDICIFAAVVVPVLLADVREQRCLRQQCGTSRKLEA